MQYSFYVNKGILQGYPIPKKDETSETSLYGMFSVCFLIFMMHFYFKTKISHKKK